MLIKRQSGLLEYEIASAIAPTDTLLLIMHWALLATLECVLRSLLNRCLWIFIYEQVRWMCAAINGFSSDFRLKPTIRAKPWRWPINTPVIHRAALNIKATRMKSATKPRRQQQSHTKCRPSVFTATFVHLHRPACFKRRKTRIWYFSQKIRRTSDHQFKIYVLNFLLYLDDDSISQLARFSEFH